MSEGPRLEESTIGLEQEMVIMDPCLSSESDQPTKRLSTDPIAESVTV